MALNVTCNQLDNKKKTMHHVGLACGAGTVALEIVSFCLFCHKAYDITDLFVDNHQNYCIQIHCLVFFFNVAHALSTLVLLCSSSMLSHFHTLLFLIMLSIIVLLCKVSSRHFCILGCVVVGHHGYPSSWVDKKSPLWLH